MCTVVLSFQPSAPVPFLLLGVRDEFTDRAWRPPGRHWAGSPLIGGIDEQAGGTWLAVDPAATRGDDPFGSDRGAFPGGTPGPPAPPGHVRWGGEDIGHADKRVACLLNGRGQQAAPEGRRSRGELPLRAAAEGAGALKELAGDPVALAAYDPFHLLSADTGSVFLLSWDGTAAACRALEPGTHLLTNVGHSYPVLDSAELAATGPGSSGVAPVTEPKAAHFGPKFAASRPSGDPGLPLAEAWGEWLALADGDGLAPDDPRAIVAGRPHPSGRRWGSTSQTLVALGAAGLRYDFRSLGSLPAGGDVTPKDWYQVHI